MNKLMLLIFALPFFLIAGVKIEQVVIPDAADPYEKLAAAEFAEYYRKMTGIEVKISNQNIPAAGVLYLGRAVPPQSVFALKELDDTGRYGGYRIRGKNGNFYITGNNCLATPIGVYRFLEQLGARFYASDCEIVPGGGNGEFAENLDILDVPGYHVRSVNYWLKQGASIFSTRAQRWRMGNNAFHTETMLCDPRAYAEKHPEYYAMDRFGKRMPEYVSSGEVYPGSKRMEKLKTYQDLYRHDVHLCYSNRDAGRAVYENAVMWVKGMPYAWGFILSPMDGDGFCACPECLKLDTEKRSYTDRVIYFFNPVINALKAKFPETDFITLVYYMCLRPPQREKMSENAIVMLCPYTPEVKDRGHWFDHPANAEFMPFYNYWIKHPGGVYIYEYTVAYSISLSFLHEQHVYRIKRYYQDGVRGFHCDGRNAFMHSLWEYMMNRLLWNPELDHTALVKEFMPVYYGAAAPEMLDIYNQLKNITAAPERMQGLAAPDKDLLTADEALQLLRVFDRAETRLDKNALEYARVMREKAYLNKIFLQNYNPVDGTAKDIGLFKTRLGELFNIRKNIMPAHKLSFYTGEIYTEPQMLAMAGIKTVKAEGNPEVDVLIKTPEALAIDAEAVRRKKPGILKIDGGWQIPLEWIQGTAGIINYNYQCERRPCVIIRSRSQQEYRRAGIDFPLDEAPQPAMTLRMTGQDSDKEDIPAIEITVNGQVIYKDKVPFGKQGWYQHDFAIPPGVLKKGGNEIIIYNMSEDTYLFSNWIAINKVEIIKK